MASSSAPICYDTPVASTFDLISLAFNIFVGCATLVVVVFTLALCLVMYEYVTFKPFAPSAEKKRSLGNTNFDPTKLPSSIDAVVVGAGQGGLSCAAVLAQFGRRVVVVEQHEVTGGGAHTFAMAGQSRKYRFNAGHHLSIPLHQQVLQLACGAAMPPVPFHVRLDSEGASDRVAFGSTNGSGLALASTTLHPRHESKKNASDSPLAVKSLDAVRDELIHRFPSRMDDIKRYYSLAESVQLRFAFFVASSLLPSWLRTWFVCRSRSMELWRKWASKTTAEGLKEVLLLSTT